MKMNFSYVMGIGPSINDLTGEGFTIEAEGGEAYGYYKQSD